MTVKEAILTLNANVVVACERARFDSATVRMIEDALDVIEDALEAQEPRVMTLDEVNRFVFGSPYIVETNIPGDEPRLMYGLYSHHGIAGNYTFDTVDRRRNLFDVDYDRFWRCWTSCPTDAQRKETPWR